MELYHFVSFLLNLYLAIAAVVAACLMVWRVPRFVMAREGFAFTLWEGIVQSAMDGFFWMLFLIGWIKSKSTKKIG